MAKQVSCFFLILFFSSTVQIQARDSFFFSKLTHYSINKHHEKKPKKLIPPLVPPTLAPTQTPAPAPAPTTILQSGLDETDLVNQELSGFSYQSNNNEYKLTGETPLTGHENENYNNNNNGYGLNENGYESSNYNNNGYSSNYKSSNNGYYEMERQGMSDTRSLENGRYYYDVKNYNPTGYEGTRNNVQSYYGNSEQSSNELKSIEEEYQNQEAYQEIPEEYVP
ncbi:hypothetical protein HS088_TW17G00091 [Tripterygium wilfordii]|uniref:Protein E6-like n=1 Tax=Tripterygium wilfordii TaxID=458696 RepID=A0A7J7CEN4_TRIWF|nr:protein E6 [Tripterygium wilfordii]KAF5732562.1 hypothetical protein HS088_TW17G00091 [Tripterygium wilfordii]